jgi:hypothetical protein
VLYSTYAVERRVEQDPSFLIVSAAKTVRRPQVLQTHTRRHRDSTDWYEENLPRNITHRIDLYSAVML